MNRRKVLQGLAAGTAGSIGLAFGSGAFTTVEAERDFDIELADSDAESQLVIEANDDLPSSATTTGDDDEFEIDGSRITPGATTTFGFFEEIDDVSTLETGVFIIRNENETGEPVDITVEIVLESSPNSELHLALLDPDDGVDSPETDSTGNGAEDTVEATVSSVPSLVEDGEKKDGISESEAEVEVGFIVEADANDEELSADMTIEAERNSS